VDRVCPPKRSRFSGFFIGGLLPSLSYTYHFIRAQHTEIDNMAGVKAVPDVVSQSVDGIAQPGEVARLAVVGVVHGVPTAGADPVPGQRREDQFLAFPHFFKGRQQEVDELLDARLVGNKQVAPYVVFAKAVLFR
jgi:uncharacterized membrane protein (GlpM family)